MGRIESLLLSHCIFRVHTDYFTLLVDISLYHVGMSTQFGDLIINMRATSLNASSNM